VFVTVLDGILIILYLSTSQEWGQIVRDLIQTEKIYSLSKQGKHRAKDSTKHVVTGNVFMAETL